MENEPSHRNLSLKHIRRTPMKNEGVKLLGLWSSPFVRRVEWALKLKGIEYEYSEEFLANKSPLLLESKSPLLLESNPVHKKVPVLLHGGKSICESLNIIQYIDEVWPENPLLPQDPHEKAVMLFWGKTVEDKLLAEGLRNILRAKDGEQERAVKQFEEALVIIEGEAKGIDKYFGGERIGYLDLVLGWTIIWLEVVEQASCGKRVLDLKKFPSFSKWMEKVKEVAVIRENLPSKEELLVYMLNIRSFILASTAKS